MGLLSSQVLTPHQNDPASWKGTDDDKVWWMRWRLYVKHWFAFATPRLCPQGFDVSIVFFPLLYIAPVTMAFTGLSWWYLFPIGFLPVCRVWRQTPKVLFAMRGDGLWRFEESFTGDESTFRLLESGLTYRNNYLSRAQYYCRWHIAIHWPLLVVVHYYPKQSDVLKPNVPREVSPETFWTFQRGWPRDADGIYWGDGGFFGRGAK
jgi:hypothetical protein